VIFTHGVLNQTRLDGELLHAGAGVPSPKIARFAAMHGLGGAEFMAGIPGTVGGALAMNAGCYGGETWNIVEGVTTLDRTGRLRQRARAEYDIGYRTVVLKDHAAERHDPHPSSLIPHPSQEWFVEAHFRLPRGDSAASRAMIKQLLVRRITTQPLNLPNAGSVFRNPPGDYAARLIEACGLKGFALGGAAISEKHANFIVNVGHASAADIEALIEIAHASVSRKFGIDLEREVRIIGEPA
jgi:UDP-N-acetylmuramate dehydrogenase